MSRVLVTGSSGLIGSEAVEHYSKAGYDVHGIDNNLRMAFFGEAGDTRWNLGRLKDAFPSYTHHEIDIRDRSAVARLFHDVRFDLIVHCAAQPSHDKAAEIPFIDFDVNAGGTLNLLEATRQSARDAVFIHMSTNKVYGDVPNELPLVETPTRYDYSRPGDLHGITEECRIDRCLHSLFGASKAAADLIAQEYGRYFGMKVGIFRGGCLTGPSHAGVPLHGFLSYLVHVAVTGKPYTVLGYKGKQVRDQIHSVDVITAFDAFVANPGSGEVFNIGGGRENAASVLECITLIRELSGHEVQWSYRDQNRIGDHICYISDCRKLKNRFPEWHLSRSLPDILKEMIFAEESRHTAISR